MLDRRWDTWVQVDIRDPGSTLPTQDGPIPLKQNKLEQLELSNSFGNQIYLADNGTWHI